MRKSYPDWKKHVSDRKIMCQWCGKKRATAKAHIIGKYTYHLLSGLDMNDAEQFVPKSDEKGQLDCNVTVGITCRDCDTYIKKYESDRKSLIPITLWKVAANFIYNEYSDSGRYYREQIVFEDSTNPTLDQLNLSKQRTKDYLEKGGKWLFTELDTEVYLPTFRKKCKKLGIPVPRRLKSVDDPYASGNGFIGSINHDKSYVMFSVHNKNFVVSTCDQSHISKFDIMVHTMGATSGTPETDMVHKPANNRQTPKRR